MDVVFVHHSAEQWTKWGMILLRYIFGEVIEIVPLQVDLLGHDAWKKWTRKYSPKWFCSKWWFTTVERIKRHFKRQHLSQVFVEKFRPIHSWEWNQYHLPKWNCHADSRLLNLHVPLGGETTQRFRSRSPGQRGCQLAIRWYFENGNSWS